MLFQTPGNEIFLPIDYFCLFFPEYTFSELASIGLSAYYIKKHAFPFPGLEVARAEKRKCGHLLMKSVKVFHEAFEARIGP